MSKRQLKRVQHLAWGGKVGQLFQALILAITIGEITDQRESQKLKMNANLVGSTSMKNRFDQRSSAQAFENTITGPRRSAHVFIDSHALAMG